MKKPVRKRKGYADGGKVDVPEGTRALKQAHGLTMQALSPSNTVPRSQADFQSGQIAYDRGMRALNLPKGAVYPEDQPEGYPPPRNRGGKVKKVVPVRKKR